jgi:hypothetical protein
VAKLVEFYILDVLWRKNVVTIAEQPSLASIEQKQKQIFKKMKK